VLEKDWGGSFDIDCLKNEVLHRAKEERNNKNRKTNWIGHILRRNCPLQHVIERNIEGRMEVTGRRGRRRKPILDNLKEE
jgi:hypothetical protein